MTTTPKSLRLHIAFFGRRNVGKSSLLNALTRQQVSIVSPVAGTTTDPVEKPMELLPLGPVLFIDTAGIDDVGELGALRVQKTRQVLERTDLAVLVAEAGAWGNFEEEISARVDRAQNADGRGVQQNGSWHRHPACDVRETHWRDKKFRVGQNFGFDTAQEFWICARRCSPPRRRISLTARRFSATSSVPAKWRCSWCRLTRKRRRAV